MRDNGVLESMQTRMRARWKHKPKPRRNNGELTEHELWLIYNSFHSHAKHRGLEWNLTMEQFEELIAAPCSYGIGQRPDIRIGLDRLDNSQGYLAGNVVPCCARHNQIRSHIFTFEDMLDLVGRYPNARECGNTTGGRKKTHRMQGKCSKGHVLSEDNVYIHRDGRIVCAICSRARLEAWKQAKIAAQSTP
jgi:hypothetical protein